MRIDSFNTNEITPRAVPDSAETPFRAGDTFEARVLISDALSARLKTAEGLAFTVRLDGSVSLPRGERISVTVAEIGDGFILLKLNGAVGQAAAFQVPPEGAAGFFTEPLFPSAPENPAPDVGYPVPPKPRFSGEASSPASTLRPAGELSEAPAMGGAASGAERHIPERAPASPQPEPSGAPGSIPDVPGPTPGASVPSDGIPPPAPASPGKTPETSVPTPQNTSDVPRAPEVFEDTTPPTALGASPEALPERAAAKIPEAVPEPAGNPGANAAPPDGGLLPEASASSFAGLSGSFHADALYFYSGAQNAAHRAKIAAEAPPPAPGEDTGESARTTEAGERVPSASRVAGQRETEPRRAVAPEAAPDGTDDPRPQTAFSHTRIPINIRGERRDAELYVRRGKKKRGADPDGTDMLLALDLPALGRWEALISAGGRDISIRMKASGDDARALLASNLGKLSEILSEAGYRLSQTRVGIIGDGVGASRAAPVESRARYIIDLSV
ncbi:MAG: flagellar hook-length control protein FliK [Oscillospiraceae bacterium]|jgi:hypothetical protein|nr:flagellar hook-length control protein FliK [Oscillospiraceae bacterium]